MQKTLFRCASLIIAISAALLCTTVAFAEKPTITITLHKVPIEVEMGQPITGAAEVKLEGFTQPTTVPIVGRISRSGKVIAQSRYLPLENKRDGTYWVDLSEDLGMTANVRDEAEYDLRISAVAGKDDEIIGQGGTRVEVRPSQDDVVLLRGSETANPSPIVTNRNTEITFTYIIRSAKKKISEATLALEGQILGPQTFKIKPDVIHWKDWNQGEKTLTGKQTVLFIKPGNYTLDYLVTCRSAKATPLHVRASLVVKGKDSSEGAFHVVSMTASPASVGVGQPVQLKISYEPGTFSGERYEVGELSKLTGAGGGEIKRGASRVFPKDFSGAQDSTYQATFGSAGVYKWTVLLSGEHRADRLAGPVTVTVVKSAAPKALVLQKPYCSFGNRTTFPTWSGCSISWPMDGQPDPEFTGTLKWSDLGAELHPGDTVTLTLALQGNPRNADREQSMSCWSAGPGLTAEEKAPKEFSFDGWASDKPKSGEMGYTIPKGASDFYYRVHPGGNSGDGLLYHYMLAEVESRDDMVDVTPVRPSQPSGPGTSATSDNSSSKTATPPDDAQTSSTQNTDSGKALPVGEQEGLGVKMGIKDGSVVLTEVTDHGLAEFMKVAPGDKVTAIDGKSTTGLTASQVEALLAGPSGSEITLQLQCADGRQISASLSRP